MVYRIIIVDDEPGIIQGIQYLIERIEVPCQVVACAYDGEDGYKKVMELCPDIVLTDVKMPGMDGIEMIRKLRQKEFHGEFVILSGYAEFEYAKSALTLGVKAYLTKPIEEEELKEVLEKICCERQQRETRDELLEKKMENYEERIARYAIKEILDKRKTDIQAWEQIGIPVKGYHYLCALLQWDGTESENLPEKICAVVQAVVKEQFSGISDIVPIIYSKNQIVLVFADKKEIDLQQKLSRLERFRKKMEELSSQTFSVGMGLNYESIEDISRSFDEAICALNYKVLVGDACTIGYHEIFNINQVSEYLTKDEIQRLSDSIDRIDMEGIEQTVKHIFERIEKKELNILTLQHLSLTIILSGIHKIPVMQIQMNEYLGKNILALENISRFQNIEQIQNWIINTLKGMSELMLKENIPTKRDVIKEAIDYMVKNYNKDISLNQISKEFFINPSYFSQLFKKKTGKTYQSYLTEIRMERARLLLTETDLRIYEICDLVGYSDQNHFNKIFQKRYHVLPSEYRKRRGL